MPPPRTSVPYAFTASTTDCPVLCSLLLDRHQLPRRLVANLRPPLLRVKINSLYTVCQETSTSNVALRLHCLRPDMRCVCLSMIQFMYISGDSAMPRPDPMDRTGQTSHHHHHRGESFNWWVLFYLIPLLMMVALLLGILKASCGCCGSSISSWKYDYMQPLHPFSRASCCRRFAINTIFFLACPCVALCNCFNPTGGDDDDVTVWSRRIVQTEYGCGDIGNGDGGGIGRFADGALCANESMQLLQKPDRLRGAGHDHQLLTGSSIDDELGLPPTMSHFEAYNDNDEERDTNYVLAALTESRNSLRLLDGHCSNSSRSSSSCSAETDAAAHHSSTADGGGSGGGGGRPASVRRAQAMTLVNRLQCAKIVYRTMREPIGNVVLLNDGGDDGGAVANAKPQSYSVRGYFLPALGTGYQFLSHTPLRQHWRFDAKSNTLQPLEPPVMLRADDFTREYRDKRDVLEANDLSVVPRLDAPCLTVLVQDISLYRMPASTDVVSTNANVASTVKTSFHVPIRDCSAP